MWPWHESGEESRGRSLALAPLGVISGAYLLGASLHRGLYERGGLARRRLPCRVLSVGSLVVGGAGKTPTAAWIAERLHARGHRVALASRGYGRSAGAPVQIASDGSSRSLAWECVGDEAPVLAAHASGVPVLVGRDRGRVGERAVEAFGIDVLVLDDAFQHHRLARDVDLLTFDGAFGLGNRRGLPRGPLRECPRALSRAHVIGVLDADLGDADRALIDAYAPRAFRYRARRRPLRLRSLDGTREFSLGELRGARLGVVAALGQPGAFERALVELGARVGPRRFFADHHRYRARDLRRLEEGVDCWITSEKDALKIPPVWAAGRDLRVLEIELDVEDAEGLLQSLEDALVSPPAPGPHAGRERRRK